MITKLVVKDYVTKNCDYLTKCELEDKTLVELLKNVASTASETLKFLTDDDEMDDEDGDKDSVFNIIDIMKEHPHLKPTLEIILGQQRRNPVEKLVDSYRDDQLISRMSRKYIASIYGEDKCYQCDVDQYGNEILIQKDIVNNTIKALKDKNIKVIFEGQIDLGKLRARFDVLIKEDDDRYQLLEVKGTNDVCTHPKYRKDIDSKIKDKYLYDILFQYYVYTKYGLKFNSVGFITLNRDYKLKKLCYPVDDKELINYFRIKTDIFLKDDPKTILEYIQNKEYVNKKQRLIDHIVDEIIAIDEGEPSLPKKCYNCRKGPACPFLLHCFPDAKDSNSIFKLTNWGEYGGAFTKTIAVFDRGVDKISDIPDDLILEKFPKETSSGKNSNAYSQIALEKGWIKNKYILDMDRIKRLLGDYLNNDIDYLVFFDFESFQDPIPLVANSTPYKQIVSQYSMHVVDKNYDLSKHDFDKGVGGGITHKEFIGNPDDDNYENPSVRLYQTAFNQLKECGVDPYSSRYKVIVFNKTFEGTRMREFIEEYPSFCEPELIKFVQVFRDNIIDLLDFFTSGAIYSRDFNGRGSLKVVQPSMTTDPDVLAFYKTQNLLFDLEYSLDYHKDDKCLVYNGAICLDLYKSLLIRHHLGEKDKGLSTQDLLKEALAYCKIDTWGTVIIFDIIKNIANGKIKLDSYYLK